MKSVSSGAPELASRGLASVALLTLPALAFVLASGCSRSEAAPQRAATHESAPPTAGGKAETETYKVEVTAQGPYAAGKEGSVTVTLEAKGTYHINDKYPLKLKLAEPAPDGVTFTKAVLKREDGKFEEKKGELKVPFTAAKAGKAKIAGVLSFSVCSEANCIMDKVELALDVEVK